MSWQAFFLAVWKWHFPACVVHGRADPLLLFHFSAPYPLQSLSAFFLPLASVERREEATALFHIFWPLNSPPDVVLPFSYIRGRFVYCPFLLVRFTEAFRRLLFCIPPHPSRLRRATFCCRRRPPLKYRLSDISHPRQAGELPQGEGFGGLMVCGRLPLEGKLDRECAARTRLMRWRRTHTTYFR